MNLNSFNTAPALSDNNANNHGPHLSGVLSEEGTHQKLH